MTVTVNYQLLYWYALGWDTNESILDLFWNGKTDEDGLPVYDERIVRTLEKDTTQSADEALVEIYKKLRPGEPPTVESLLVTCSITCSSMHAVMI